MGRGGDYLSPPLLFYLGCLVDSYAFAIEVIFFGPLDVFRQSDVLAQPDDFGVDVDLAWLNPMARAGRVAVVSVVVAFTER